MRVAGFAARVWRMFQAPAQAGLGARGRKAGLFSTLYGLLSGPCRWLKSAPLSNRETEIPDIARRARNAQLLGAIRDQDRRTAYGAVVVAAPLGTIGSDGKRKGSDLVCGRGHPLRVIFRDSRLIPRTC
jgi:hypothetical protein